MKLLSPAAPLVFATIAAVAMASSVHAQSPESDPANTMTYQPPSRFIVPDVPDQDLTVANVDNRHITFDPGLSILLDYTSFHQDAASYQQVGNEEDQLELRSFRFIGRGKLKFLNNWNYMVTAEYKGFGNVPNGEDWQLTDAWIQLNIGNTHLRVGKQKESFVYEEVGDAANLPQSERLLSPFFVSRSIGISWSGTGLSQRSTWTIGWYNDWLTYGDSFSSSGNDFAARYTLLPVLADNGARYLHLGVATRYYGGDNNQLRFRGRPESNVADYYLDTGNLPGDHAWQGAVEAMWADHNYSLLAEYAHAWVRSASTGDPQLSGFYITASYVPNGLPRPYDTNVAYARRVPVTNPWGSCEFVLRYGHVDLDDAGASGGTLDKWYAAVNWWATKRWKASIGYGDADLDRLQITGNTKILLTRLQWIY